MTFEEWGVYRGWYGFQLPSDDPKVNPQRRREAEDWIRQYRELGSEGRMKEETRVPTLYEAWKKPTKMDEINPRSSFMRFYEAEMKDLLRDMRNWSNNSSREPQADLLSQPERDKKPKKICSCFR